MFEVCSHGEFHQDFTSKNFEELGNIMSLTDEFIKIKSGDLKVFHTYGHSYELDLEENIGWNGINNLLKEYQI